MGSKTRHRWFVDFTEGKRRSHRQEDDTLSPPGYSRSPMKDEDGGSAADASLVTKMGWTLALGPWKQLPLNLFVLWMAGNSISLFPIMMVGMMLMRPVQAIFNCKQVFNKLSGDQAPLQIMVYVLANVVGVCLGLYKINAMGLLPTHQSDWLEFILVRDLGHLQYSCPRLRFDEVPRWVRFRNLNLEVVGGGLAMASS